MNIIEDIWDALLHAVEKRSPPPRTPTDFLTALQESWCEFPPGYLQTSVESMPHRDAALLNDGDDHDPRPPTHPLGLESTRMMGMGRWNSKGCQTRVKWFKVQKKKRLV
ncbi:hypothetical protein AVEN_185474-1 [Araneus ventricosus]|uniref:Uncharacterized protein n=1 Tax=Araneus ventricosus TaxID=182803 RepID=A0A4Y2HDL7_ARAVE|nr:hypothetical protein AVEN_185474-1 [Araneus ventricosus]